ncbi:MAG: hypothetical protein ACLPUX_14460, partial [Syntrophobacteraceae bacterium]
IMRAKTNMPSDPPSISPTTKPAQNMATSFLITAHRRVAEKIPEFRDSIPQFPRVNAYQLFVCKYPAKLIVWTTEAKSVHPPEVAGRLDT